MDILATLQNCVNAVAGIRPRIDQPEIHQTGQALINTLRDMIPEVQGLMDRVAQLEKEKASQDNQKPAEEPEEKADNDPWGDLDEEEKA